MERLVWDDGSFMALIKILECTAILVFMLGMLYALPFFKGRKSRGKSLRMAMRSQTEDQKWENTPHSTRGKEAKTAVSGIQYPKSWWTEERHFQLERRAIFSKKWLFVTHTSRFQKPGDYRTFEIAGFSFIVILGKDKQVRAFHNVCRHRAYAVTKKECGSSIVLGCRYHGWSYDTKGKLIKAPEFENVEGFDMGSIGLWELKIRIMQSLVFINFDATATGEPSFDLPENNLLAWNIGNMTMFAEWKVEGHFNWKLAEGGLFLDSIGTGPPSIWSRILDMMGNSQEECAIFCSGKIVRLQSGMVVTIRFLPESKNKTTIECIVYHGGFFKTMGMKKELETLKLEIDAKIGELEAQQRKLLSSKCNIPSINLGHVEKFLEAHLEAEKQGGVAIHPAARKEGFTQEGLDDDELCKEIETDRRVSVKNCVATNEKLDW